jgi:sialate O-acetylesterase
MIHGWRALWGDDLPFLFVQLAPFGEWMGSTGEAFPELRRQQQLVADTIPGTWMASSSDAGMKWDIHPKHKRPIGRRLALLARRHLYGHKVLADPPEFLSAERTADGIEIRLRVAGDLSLGPGPVPVEVRSPSGDLIAPTGIRVDGDRLLLAGSFPSGSTVRFAWSAYYRVNVVDAAGNPATPFLIRV